MRTVQYKFQQTIGMFIYEYEIQIILGRYIDNVEIILKVLFTSRAPHKE